jgi:Sap, sulfolipid-1-addressing protein
VSWAEYLLLAVASIFWPLLFAIVLVALRSEHPVRMLATFLVSGLMTTTAVGCAIVFSIESTNAFSRSSTTGRPAVYLAAGALALFAAYFVARRPPKPQEDASKLRRYVSSVPVAFGAGVVLNLFPGVFPLVALMNIAQVDTTAAGKTLLILGFYVIMFASVEVPLLCYGFAPDRTAAVVATFNQWLSRNGRRLAVWVLALIGLYLLARGALLLV